MIADDEIEEIRFNVVPSLTDILKACFGLAGSFTRLGSGQNKR
jgi:hypothetical protein